MSYPTAPEISAALGITVPAAVLSGVIAEFERRSGWLYFLPSTQTMYYSCDGSRDLWLDCGLISLTSLTIDGTTYTENTDFELWPYNRSPKKKIRFRGIPFSEPRGIVVVGSWGYAATVPADVRLAIMEACATVVRELATGPVSSIRQGPVSIELASGSGSSFEDALARTPSFMAAINRYRFRTL